MCVRVWHGASGAAGARCGVVVSAAHAVVASQHLHHRMRRIAGWGIAGLQSNAATRTMWACMPMQRMQGGLAASLK